ncbi:hypothetical protein [Paraburkholderia terrae]|uniref:hypothetical protein n=1 Tax=Paraburkholderia terrae TaxID=311230 RepID=UPI0012E069CA|nr:hypothetical protein [Paraburkholderia terrae]
MDFKKVPPNPDQSRRYAIYGDVLACFLFLQEWEPSVVSFGMGEGKRPVTEDDPAVDASAPVISKLASGEYVWTTCVTGLPKSKRGKNRLDACAREAREQGARHQIFTYDDGRANHQRLENVVTLNSMLHRVPGDRYDCRVELAAIRDALKLRPTTTLEYLQAAEGVSVAKMQGSVAALLHSGDLETVKGLDRETFSLVSELRWSKLS